MQSLISRWMTVVVVALLCLAMVPTARADDATSVPATPIPADVCPAEAVARGEALTRYAPDNPELGIMPTVALGEQKLALITLAPNSCLETGDYHNYMLYIMSGDVFVQISGRDSVIEAAVDPGDIVELVVGQRKLVTSGTWINVQTQSRYGESVVLYNAGATDAVVVFSGENGPPEADGCTGGCPGRRRP